MKNAILTILTICAIITVRADYEFSTITNAETGAKVTSKIIPDGSNLVTSHELTDALINSAGTLRDKGDLAVYTYSDWTVEGGRLDGQTFVFSYSDSWTVNWEVASTRAAPLNYQLTFERDTSTWRLRNTNMMPGILSTITDSSADVLSLDCGDYGVFTRTAVYTPASPDDTLALLSEIPSVVAPSSSASDSGKAADAKATGDALAGKLGNTGDQTLTGRLTINGSLTSITDYHSVNFHGATIDVVQGGILSHPIWPDRDGKIALLSQTYDAVTNIAPAWVSNTTYRVNALVTYNGVVYCNTGGDTFVSNIPPRSDTNWAVKNVSELFLPLTGGTLPRGAYIAFKCKTTTSGTPGLFVEGDDFYLVSSGLGSDYYRLRSDGRHQSLSEYDVLRRSDFSSPAFTGTPTISTTPSLGDNSHKIADTAFVQQASSNRVLAEQCTSSGTWCVNDGILGTDIIFTSGSYSETATPNNNINGGSYITFNTSYFGMSDNETIQDFTVRSRSDTGISWPGNFSGYARLLETNDLNTVLAVSEQFSITNFNQTVEIGLKPHVLLGTNKTYMIQFVESLDSPTVANNVPLRLLVGNPSPLCYVNGNTEWKPMMTVNHFMSISGQMQNVMNSIGNVPVETASQQSAGFLSSVGSVSGSGSSPLSIGTASELQGE